MENQTINCSVSSCRHHNAQNRCELRSINVCANCNGTVKYYAQIHLQVWQNSVCTGQGNLPLIT